MDDRAENSGADPVSADEDPERITDVPDEPAPAYALFLFPLLVAAAVVGLAAVVGFAVLIVLLIINHLPH
jgi:hypothetical protein